MPAPKPLLAAAALFASAVLPLPAARAGDLQSVTHAFTLALDAPVARAAPLFGPVREAEWSPAWKPAFLHPAEPAQVEGAVFTTGPDPQARSLWILTDYAPAEGRIAYVVVAPGVLATQIRVALVPRGTGGSSATVTYRRWALAPAGNALVEAFAKHADSMGPHWEAAVNGALARERAP
jgi:hypothetical protein